ncbi:MAG: DUF3460 family protein [Telluria sp.]
MEKVTHYVSPFETFMDGFLAKHPDVVDDQQRGWYIWWDHRLDLDNDDAARDNEVPAKAYKYD